jgi:tRNA (cytidine/uridine-2'-O-)-methyltransferase
MPEGPKIRTAPLVPPFRVVLVEPEIPPNTGAVARTCAATTTPLHLVGHLGFRIDDHAVRRAGLDYWHLVDLHTHDTLYDFVGAHPEARLHLFSSAARETYLAADFRPGDALVFGKESVGLGPSILEQYGERSFAIPTSGGVRSLNLSNAVSIVLFEALRQVGALDPTGFAPARPPPVG